MLHSPTEIVQLAERAQNGGYLANMLTTMTEMEKLYALDFPLEAKLPADVPKHVPSTAPAKVDTFAAQVRTMHPEITLGNLGRGPRNQKRLDALRAAGRHWLQNIDQYEDEPTWDFTKFNLTLLGASAVRVLFDEDEWPRAKADKRHAWPFRVRAVHPSQVIISPGFRWPYSYVIEHQQRSYADLRGDYPEWAELTKTQQPWKPDTALDVYFYWDNEHYIAVAGATYLDGFPKPNLLGIPPWVWSFSGLGHKARDGDPNAQALGILRHTKSELQAQARNRSYADVVWRAAAIPMAQGTVATEDVRARMAGGGAPYIELDTPDDKFEWIKPPELNAAQWAMMDALERSITQGTFSDVLAGEAGGSRAGTQFAFQTGQARLRTDPVHASLERMAGRVLSIVGRYYERVLRTDIEVEGVTLRPADISGFEDFKVRYHGTDPLSNSELKNTGLAALAHSAISKRMYLRDYEKVDDVEASYDEILQEKAEEQAMAAGMLSADMAQRMGETDQADAQSAQNEQMLQQAKLSGREALGAPLGAPRGAPFGNRRPELISGDAGVPDSSLVSE